MPSTLCIGHRGSKGTLPENTLPSFKQAIKVGCEWVELDVYHVEGELLVIHDKSVERTTNGKGLVSELSFDEIRALDAGGVGARVEVGHALHAEVALGRLRPGVAAGRAARAGRRCVAVEVRLARRAVGALQPQHGVAVVEAVGELAVGAVEGNVGVGGRGQRGVGARERKGAGPTYLA